MATTQYRHWLAPGGGDDDHLALGPGEALVLLHQRVDEAKKARNSAGRWAGRGTRWAEAGLPCAQDALAHVVRQAGEIGDG